MSRGADEEARALAVAIVIGVLAFLWFIAWLQLQAIYFSRFMFWITFLSIPISIIAGILFGIIGYQEGKTSYVYYHDNTNQTIFFGIVAFSMVALLFSLLTIDNFYQSGYSNEALQREAKLKNQMQEFEAIIDLMTGQTIVDTTNQALEETIDDLCLQNPDFPCEQMKGNYQIYIQIKGAKDTADFIAKVLGIVKFS